MIYIDNKSGVQTIRIPRDNYNEVIAEKVFQYRPQEKHIVLSGTGTFEIIPDDGYTAMTKVIVSIQ